MNGNIGQNDLPEGNQRHAKDESDDRRGGSDMGDLAEAAGRFVDTIGMSVGGNLKQENERKDGQQEGQWLSEAAEVWVLQGWHSWYSADTPKSAAHLRMQKQQRKAKEILRDAAGICKLGLGELEEDANGIELHFGGNSESESQEGHVRNAMRIYLLVMVVVLAGQRSLGQSGVASDVKNAEIQAVAQSDLTSVLNDHALRVVDIEGKYNVGVGVVHRIKTTGPDSSSGIEHRDITEVYHVISGSGTLVTGGVIEDKKPAKPEIVKTVGPSMSGDKARGGVSREIGPGDVVIIPPNTPHWFSRIDAEMVYLVVRVDAKKVLAPVEGKK